METMYHEKQEGQLCAQHCLNNLLQGSHFTAVDLAKIAEQLDQEEAATLMEGEVDFNLASRSSAYSSANMDDTGFFSVQVIARALSVWGLVMSLWNSVDMRAAMDDPTTQNAFICNHDSHWLTIRKFGTQWFNLNSLLWKPELISNTYLSLFLAQLQLEGYAIFVVVGTLPPCEANELLTLIPVEAEKHAHPKRETNTGPSSYGSYDLDLAAAMSASMDPLESVKNASGSESKSQTKTTMSDVCKNLEDSDLATALRMSMQDHVHQTAGQQGSVSQTEPSKQTLGMADLSDPLAAQSETSRGPPTHSEVVSGDGQTTVELSVEELRQRRLRHLGKDGELD